MNQRDAAKNAVAHLPLPSAEAGSRLGSHIQEEELKRLPTLLAVALEVALAAPGTDWADYVFEPSYKAKMLTLNEVEKYTLLHKHLPNVPSTSDVEANGINVVEMQATLLQKIEELTLYLLQENKRITKLEKENAELKQLLKK